jgi:acyl dehydratase
MTDAHMLDVKAGDSIPSLELPPLTRATLALYAGGSGDHLPLHIDSDFARAAGYQDEFMHGMLGAAYITRMVTSWVPQEYLRGLAVRFVAITYPGESLTAMATVAAVTDDGHVELEVVLRNARGETKLTGHALIGPSAPIVQRLQEK